jgi:hypothetical protein
MHGCQIGTKCPFCMQNGTCCILLFLVMAYRGRMVNRDSTNWNAILSFILCSTNSWPMHANLRRFGLPSKKCSSTIKKACADLQENCSN